MMYRPRVVGLVIASMGVLAISALVARSGPRAIDQTGGKNTAAPGGADGPAPSTSPRTEAAKADGAKVKAIHGPDAAAPAVLTPRDVAALVSEASLMVRLHQLAETDPPISLELAREGNARFPHSPEAPERAFIVVKSLVDMGRFKEAQQEARRMLKDYPNDPHTLDVERHLLSNPLE
jgi:TolA-binding protein